MARSSKGSKQTVTAHQRRVARALKVSSHSTAGDTFESFVAEHNRRVSEYRNRPAVPKTWHEYPPHTDR